MRITKDEATAGKRTVVFECKGLDGISPVLGLTFAAADLKVSKGVAAEANCASFASVVENGGGVYRYPYSAGEVDTLGALALRTSIVGVSTFYRQDQVI